MRTKKVYLLTEEQMQSVTDKLCLVSKMTENPSVSGKISDVNNMLAQLPSIAGSDTLDIAIEKVAKVKEGGEE